METKNHFRAVLPDGNLAGATSTFCAFFNSIDEEHRGASLVSSKMASSGGKKLFPLSVDPPSYGKEHL